MHSCTTADTTQLSEIPKSMWFLFLLGIFKQTKHAEYVYTSCWPERDVQRQVWLSQITILIEIVLQGHFHSKNYWCSFGTNWFCFLFPWRLTYFCRSCVVLSNPEKYKIKDWNFKIIYISFYEDKEYYSGVMHGVKRQVGKVRGKVHDRPTVLIHLKTQQHINCGTVSLF